MTKLGNMWDVPDLIRQTCRGRRRFSKGQVRMLCAVTQTRLLAGCNVRANGVGEAVYKACGWGFRTGFREQLAAPDRVGDCGVEGNRSDEFQSHRPLPLGIDEPGYHILEMAGYRSSDPVETAGIGLIDDEEKLISSIRLVEDLDGRI